MTKTAKTVTNILKWSSTQFVSNIRHQHRCSHVNFLCYRPFYIEYVGNIFLYRLKGTTSDGPIAPGLPGAKTKGECYPCPPGNYCFPGEEQKPCPSGTFQREPGASALSDCTPCLPGKSHQLVNPELTENSKDTIVCTRRRAM